MFLSPFEDILSLLFRDREGGRIEGEIDDRYIERERGRERERERNIYVREKYGSVASLKLRYVL